MRISRPVLWMACVGGVAAWALMVGAWSWSLRSEADGRLGRAMALEARGRALRVEAESSIRRSGELMDSLRDLSNRMAEVTVRLEEERKTQDPLRRQIEQMLAEQVRARDTVRQRDASLAGMESSLEALRRTNEVWCAKAVELGERVNRLELEAKESGAREAILRGQLEEARQDAAGRKAQAEETARRLEETTRLLEQARKSVEKPGGDSPASGAAADSK